MVVVVVGGVLGLNPELLYLKPAEESHSLSLRHEILLFGSTDSIKNEECTLERLPLCCFYSDADV